MMWGYGGGGLGLAGWLGLIGIVVLVVGVIVLIVWLVTRSGANTSQSSVARPAGQDAVELLRMRFARGEITEDEYRAARKVLEEGR